jgi:hypothetical protein
MSDIKVGDIVVVRNSGGITWSVQPYKRTAYLSRKRVINVHEDGTIITETGGFIESFTGKGNQQAVRPAGKVIGVEQLTEK